MASNDINDIEKLIGTPMQYPINFSTGDEYYQPNKSDEYADDEMSEIDEMSDNSIEYCECDDDCDDDNYQMQENQQSHQQTTYQQTKYQQEQYKQKIQEQQYKQFIESLQFMSLNEQQIMLYQGYSDHCVIQMEF